MAARARRELRGAIERGRVGIADARPAAALLPRERAHVVDAPVADAGDGELHRHRTRARRRRRDPAAPRSDRDAPAAPAPRRGALGVRAARRLVAELGEAGLQVQRQRVVDLGLDLARGQVRAQGVALAAGTRTTKWCHTCAAARLGQPERRAVEQRAGSAAALRRRARVPRRQGAAAWRAGSPPAACRCGSCRRRRGARTWAASRARAGGARGRRSRRRRSRTAPASPAAPRFFDGKKLKRRAARCRCPSVRQADRLRRVLDDGHARLARSGASSQARPNRCTGKMARVLRVTRASAACGVEVEGARIDVGEHRARAQPRDGAGGGEERQRRGHHLVAGADAERHERDQQRVGAARHRDGVAHARSRRRARARSAATSSPRM